MTLSPQQIHARYVEWVNSIALVFPEELAESIPGLCEEIASLKAQLAASEQACAEMRKVLEACDTYLAGASQPTNRAIIKHALSSDCGTGYIRKSDVLPLVGALAFYADHKKWTQGVAQGSIEWDDGTRAYDGEPFMAFSDGEDHPWVEAKDALTHAKAIGLETL